MKKDDVIDDLQPSNKIGLWSMAFIALLAHLASTELHESIHFMVGRLAGLPSHFLSLTSVGVDPSVAANASPSALALMNGVAPIATMLLGILALVAAPALRKKAPAAFTAFVAWWAIFGVPYIGLQTMTTAGPIRLRGDGSDFAAVLGGYFGVPILPRTGIAVAGLLIFLGSGFCLGAAVSERSRGTLPCLSLRERLRVFPLWRLVAASFLALLLIAMTVRSATLLAHGNAGAGLITMLEETLVWAAMMALLVRWRAPDACKVRDHWIFPGLLASAAMIALGLLTHNDFFVDGIVYTVPLVATAWILNCASPNLYERERT